MSDEIAGDGDKVVFVKGRLGPLKEMQETLVRGGVPADLVRPPDCDANG